MTASLAPRLTMDSAEWYSTPALVEAARELFGGRIDLDPASHEEANRIVKAERFYDEQKDGLRQSWDASSLFLNPPGGLVDAFWKKLIAETWNVREAVWIGYSLEQLQTLQVSNVRTPLDHPLCFPSRRIAFVENAAKKAARIGRLIEEGERPGATARKRKIAADCRLGKPPKDAPSHGNYITYIGPNALGFEAMFSQFGKVRV